MERASLNRLALSSSKFFQAATCAGADADVVADVDDPGADADADAGAAAELELELELESAPDQDMDNRVGSIAECVRRNRPCPCIDLLHLHHRHVLRLYRLFCMAN